MTFGDKKFVTVHIIFYYATPVFLENRIFGDVAQWESAGLVMGAHITTKGLEVGGSNPSVSTAPSVMDGAFFYVLHSQINGRRSIYQTSTIRACHQFLLTTFGKPT